MSTGKKPLQFGGVRLQAILNNEKDKLLEFSGASGVGERLPKTLSLASFILVLIFTSPCHPWVPES